MRTIAVRLLVGVVALGWFSPAGAQWNHFFRHISGDVVDVRVTQDGTRAVFLADLEVDEVFELFTVPTDGSSAPVRLSPPLTQGGDAAVGFFSPDGQLLAFGADAITNAQFELYVVPVDGSAPAVLVTTHPDIGTAATTRFTPDSTRFVFVNRTDDQRSELWCMAIDGSGAVEVSAPMPPDGSPLSDFLISPDSTLIVYRADGITDGVHELFSAPLDASAPAVKLNPTPVARGSVRNQILTPDGSRVIYRADQDTAGIYELYSVPIDGSGPAVRISLPPTANADVEDGFSFTPAGDVIYLADHDTNNARELYLVPADGSAPAVRLNAAMQALEVCEDYVTTASGYVVYRADADSNDVIELYSAPLDGSQATVKISGPMVSGGDVQSRYEISPDGTLVVYLADQDTNNLFEVYVAPLDGSSAPTKLNPTLSPGTGVAVHTPIDPSGALVVFAADVTGDFRYELLAAPIDGSSAAVVLNDQGQTFPPDFTGYFGFVPGNKVVYRGVLDPTDSDFIEELFVVPLDASAAPLKLHPRPAWGEMDGDILDFDLSPDGLEMVYIAREREGGFGMYTAPLSSPTTPLRLASGDSMGEFLVGDERVVFRSHNTSNFELFSVPLDASAPPVLISGTPVVGIHLETDFAITSDGGWVVYRANSLSSGIYELFSAPIDGTMPPTPLCGAMVQGGDVTSFRLSPDGTYVVYLADQEFDTQPELYSVPVDGSAAPVKLNGVLPMFCQVQGDYLIHPDSSRVFYRADEDLQWLYELHSVPIDGSAPATELNGVLANGGEVLDFQLDASGGWMVYRAEQDTHFQHELYSGPSDGSAAAVKLNPPLVNNGDVGNYSLSLDASLVVFSADAVADGLNEVWGAPTDGSAAAIRLHAPISGQVDFGLRALAPDGAYAVLGRSASLGGPSDLYAVPTDASASPAPLHEPSVQGAQIPEIIITPDSSRVLYRATHDLPNVLELYSAPLDGSSMASKISGLLDPNADVLTGLRISAESANVLFIADRIADEVYELFIVPVEGGITPARAHPPLVDPRFARIRQREPSLAPGG